MSQVIDLELIAKSWPFRAGLRLTEVITDSSRRLATESRHPK